MSKKTTEQEKTRFADEMAESFNDLLQLDLIDEATHKLTMRDLDRAPPSESNAPLTGADIKDIRERAKLSQALFARYLNLTADHLSKLERGTKHPTGPALVLLNVIRRKGLEAIL